MGHDLDDDELPPCHALGENPSGYDRDDPLCTDCGAKVSCLVATEEEGLTDWTVADDCEVALMIAASHTREPAIIRAAHYLVTERQRKRIRLRVVGKRIQPPPDLAVTVPLEMPTVTSAIRDVERDGPAGAPRPTQALPEPEGMPKPRKLTPQKMEAAIDRIRIGQPFPLRPGHVLVRHTRGYDVCVALRPDGFWLNLNGRTYPSLSYAAMAAEHMLGLSTKCRRSGNRYFSIAHHIVTEIRDARTGAVLARKRGTGV